MIPKEHIGIYGGGRTAIIDDFRRDTCVCGNVRTIRSSGQDKGQKHMLAAFMRAVRAGGPSPIPLDQLVSTTLTTFRIQDSIRTGTVVPVGWLS